MKSLTEVRNKHEEFMKELPFSIDLSHALSILVSLLLHSMSTSTKQFGSRTANSERRKEAMADILTKGLQVDYVKHLKKEAKENRTIERYL